MASLQRSADGIYRLAFRFPPGRSGRQFKRSLETKVEKEANELKAVVQRTIRHVQEGVAAIPSDNPTDDQLWQFLRSGGKVAALPSVKDRVRLRPISERYYREIAGNDASADTSEIHHRHLVRILGNVWIDEIGPAELRSYIKTRQAEPGIRGGTVAGDTIRKELSSFSALWNFAESEGLVDGTNPLSKVKLPKKRVKPPFMTWDQIETKINRGGLTEGEIAELWDCLFLYEGQIWQFLRHVEKAAKGRRYPFIYPMLSFCAYTGARRSEAFRAQIDDVNGHVLLREKKGSKDHDETYREVPLHASLSAVLDQWLVDHPGGQHLFVKANGQPLEDKSSRDAFAAVVRGSRWERLRGFHVLRHSFASNLARHGVDDRVIRNLMGHRAEEMTERYRHLFPEEKEAAVALLDF